MGGPYQQPYGSNQPSAGPVYGYPQQSGSALPPTQPPPKIAFKFNGHGIFGLAAIILIIGVAFILKWNIIWWYFVLAILAYSIAIINITSFEERTNNDEKRFQAFRWLLGCHTAFLFLAGGFWLNFSDIYVQMGIFVAAVAIGLAIPFLLLRKK